MAAMNATTTGAGLTLGTAERRSWSPRQLMGRLLARRSGETAGSAAMVGDVPGSRADAAAWRPDHAWRVRDVGLWSARPGRLS
jgi:hypothetical protein